jgi:superfamily II RNA helicase
MLMPLRRSTSWNRRGISESGRFRTGLLDYLQAVQNLRDRLEGQPALNRVVVPDLWQQEAVVSLRQGLDVVVQAPTGAGKTLIFELWSNQGRSPGQAVYTVPTRALANDKLAEWRARGWDVGISTGDLSENLQAPVIVATLETQKQRLIQGDGPRLLVVDEYQMLGDPDRGLNYELALDAAVALKRQRGESPGRGPLAGPTGPQGRSGPV